jgi:PleD family two-component response regulator
LETAKEYIASMMQRSRDRLAGVVAHSHRSPVAADHWANRKLLQSMLEKQGYTSEWVENGKEAVEAAATREFDLILMVRVLVAL